MSLVDETAPTLGGPLQLAGFDINANADVLIDGEGSIVIDLGDLGGATTFRIRDSGSEDVFSCDSNGNLIIKGTIVDQADAGVLALAWLKTELPVDDFWKAVIQGATAGAAQTALSVDAAGTDNAPAASATVAGKIELATQAEVDAGTVTNMAVTPETLASFPNTTAAASATAAGKVELATQGEVDAGTDTSRVVTPATLASYSGLGTAVVAASDVAAGIIELATQAEVDAGTVTNMAVTPETLAAFPNNTASTSSTVAGIIELATQAEVDAGTVTNMAVTPETLASFPNNTAAGSTTVSGTIEIATQAEVDAGTDTTRSITPETLAAYPLFVSSGIIVALTGGTSTKLDSVLTPDLAVGSLQQVFCADDTILTYRLDSGTSATDAPWIVRPQDYATTTNEQFWTLVGPFNTITHEILKQGVNHSVAVHSLFYSPDYMFIKEVQLDIGAMPTGGTNIVTWDLQKVTTTMFTADVTQAVNSWRAIADEATGFATGVNKLVPKELISLDLTVTGGGSVGTGLLVHIKHLYSPINS